MVFNEKSAFIHTFVFLYILFAYLVDLQIILVTTDFEQFGYEEYLCVFL